MKTVYKCVWYNGTQITSLYAPKPASVRYKVGKWTETPLFLKAQGLYLCAFESYDAASAFASKQSRPAGIFEARAHVVKNHAPRRIGNGFSRLMQTAKADLFEQANYWQLDVWPKGTVHCSKIMLVKQLC